MRQTKLKVTVNLVFILPLLATTGVLADLEIGYKSIVRRRQQ